MRMAACRQGYRTGRPHARDPDDRGGDSLMGRTSIAWRAARTPGHVAMIIASLPRGPSCSGRRERPPFHKPPGPGFQEYHVSHFRQARGMMGTTILRRGSVSVFDYRCDAGPTDRPFVELTGGHHGFYPQGVATCRIRS